MDRTASVKNRQRNNRLCTGDSCAGKTGSTASFSMMLLALFLPSVLLNPAGGVLADRKNRKLLIAAGDFGAAAGVAVIIAVCRFSPNNIYYLFAGVSLISVFSALHSPSYKSFITDILDKEQYSKAAGLIQLTEASRYLLSPAIAALLIKKISLISILWIDCISFIAASAAALLIKTNTTIEKKGFKTAENTFLKDLIIGFRYIHNNSFTASLTCVTASVTFLTGMLQVLFTPVLISIADASSAGNIMSLSASGMLISSMAVSIFKADNQRRSLKLSLTAAGIFCFLIGISTNIPSVTVSAFCFFLTLPVINTSIEVLLRENISNDVQGRVWSMISFITQSGMLLSLSVTGILADRVFNPLFNRTSPFTILTENYFKMRSDAGSSLMIAASGILLISISSLSVLKFKKL